MKVDWISYTSTRDYQAPAPGATTAASNRSQAKAKLAALQGDLQPLEGTWRVASLDKLLLSAERAAAAAAVELDPPDGKDDKDGAAKGKGKKQGKGGAEAVEELREEEARLSAAHAAAEGAAAAQGREMEGLQRAARRVGGKVLAEAMHVQARSSQELPFAPRLAPLYASLCAQVLPSPFSHCAQVQDLRDAYAVAMRETTSALDAQRVATPPAPPPAPTAPYSFWSRLPSAAQRPPGPLPPELGSSCSAPPPLLVQRGRPPCVCSEG